MLELAKLIDLIVGFASPVVQNKLQRSELVIKLLKQLNLDPDHPPADFTAVYQYTLVEYGIGKPKPVLELFRQAEIQAIFRKALDQNNPSLLLKDGETFLAGHSLGDQIQALGIDARQEFYQFAAVFIEVAKRTRTPAEVLANQRLESLHRQIGSIQERLHRLPTLEAMRTEMARLAAQGYPLLPSAFASQFPEGVNTTPALAQERQFQESQCRAFALAQQMKGWFETLGYRFESYEVWQDDYFEWMIDIPVRRGRYDRILVRGIDGEVGLRDVRALRQSVETQRADEGWLVTARRISRAARDAVEQEENHDLGCYTFDELLDQDADFGGYLDWLESEIERRGIDQKYVPLACTKEENDPDTKQRIGVSRYDDRDGWIDGYIDLWLNDPAKEHISVLGEFGTGKTWFAFHYASQSLKRYREAQQRGVERPRLPLVIPLRDYAKAVSVESLFSEFFFRKHEVRSLTYSAFEQLNRMGKLLLIFDGFDEMAARVDRQEMINNFWELAKVVVPGAKVILTCRTEHFPEAREGRALLNAQLQASVSDLTGEMPQFEVLELEKFNDQQIRQVMSQQAESGTVEQVMSNPQLLDLARRPVMTELILEALPDIEAGKPVDMSRVYLYAVRRKMERDIKEERTFTSLADKLYFLCELSWEMLSSDRMSLNYREFPDRIRRLFGSVVQEEKDLDHWHYDMMGQTLLIRNADGDYAPAHRSLLEFFVAYKFAAELGALAPDFLELAQGRSDIDNSLPAREYTWSEYFGERTQVAPLSGFVSEPLETLRSGFGEKALAKAVIELMKSVLDVYNSSVKHPLINAIESTESQNFEQVQYIGGNAATLLSMIDQFALSDRNLSATSLRKADFTKANLRNSDFSQTDLSEAEFSKTSGSVWSIALSSDNKHLITGDSTGRIYTFEIGSSRQTSVFKGHLSAIRSLLILPGTNFLISAASDNLIKLWDIKSQTCLKIFQGHTNIVTSIALSQDYKTLVSGSADQTIKVWTIESGQCLMTIEGHIGWIRSVAYNSENNLIASAGQDQSVRLWDSVSGESKTIFSGHTKEVNSVALDRSGKFLASGSVDGNIRVWNIETGKCFYILNDHFGGVNKVTFNQSGSLLISSSYDYSIKFWDINTGKCIKTLEAHDAGWMNSLLFSQSEDIMVSSTPKEAKIWYLNEGDSFSSFKFTENDITSVSFHPDGNTIASGSANRSVKLWNAQLGNCLAIFNEHKNWVLCVRFSRSGKLVASSSSDGTIRIWDIANQKCIRCLIGHEKSVSSVVFDKSDKILVSCSNDKHLKIWDIENSNCLISIKDDSRITSVDFSASRSWLASGNSQKLVKIWDSQTGNHILTLAGHLDWVRTVVFSPSEDFLATGSSDRTVRIWDLKKQTCVHVLQGHTDWVNSIAFGTSDTLIASCGFDCTIRLWNIFTGECLKILEGHSTPVLSIAFSPDAKTIIGSSISGAIRIWDVASGKCINKIVDRPYEGMNITGVKGLSAAEIATLKALGAVEDK